MSWVDYKLIPEEDLTKEKLLEVVRGYEDKTKELENQLKFAVNISEVDIKLDILRAIESEEDEKVLSSLQSLFLSIYCYPDDLFRMKSVDDLINETMEIKKIIFDSYMVRIEEEIKNEGGIVL